jgi:hypothetical protein
MKRFGLAFRIGATALAALGLLTAGASAAAAARESDGLNELWQEFPLDPERHSPAAEAGRSSGRPADGRPEPQAARPLAAAPRTGSGARASDSSRFPVLAAGIALFLVLAGAAVSYAGGVSQRPARRRRRAQARLPRLSLHPAVGTAVPAPGQDVVGGLLRAASPITPRRTATESEPQAPGNRAARESEDDLLKSKPDLPRVPDKETKTEAGADAELLKRKLPAAATEALKAKGNESGRTKAFTSAEDAVLKEKLVSMPGHKQAAPLPGERSRWARPRARRTKRESVLRPAPAPAVVRTPPDVRDGRAAKRSRECEIHSWRGYVMSEFFAVEVNPDGSRARIATSPQFRWRKRDAPRKTPEAVAALKALVTTLKRDGWIVAGHGEEWFGLRLRSSVTAEHADTADGDQSNTG